MRHHANESETHIYWRCRGSAGEFERLLSPTGGFSGQRGATEDEGKREGGGHARVESA